MASATVNVVRYTALITGIFYGVAHKRTLQAAQDLHREQEAQHHHDSLVEKAKEAWRQKQSSSGDGIIMDPEDPKFDLEKLLAKYEKES